MSGVSYMQFRKTLCMYFFSPENVEDTHAMSIIFPKMSSILKMSIWKEGAIYFYQNAQINTDSR